MGVAANQNPQVILIAGPNGAGKSTLAPILLRDEFELMEFVNAEVNLLFIWLNSPELAIERVKQRVIAGGHDIPEETIRRRYQNGARNFFALYQPLADEWGVYDNSELVNAVLIASGEGQTTQIVFEPERWASFCEVAK
ncbi:MAG: hypothetical protein L0Y75_10295 [Acidobacteria bacterium]|nr:hypothetical protein [Acidobacteriota bacterium]